MAAKVLLNALHTTTGGGLIYLQNILPHLAADRRFAFTLLAPKETFRKLKLPKNLKRWEAPVLGFAAGHLWEQLVLPFAARGFEAVWCNANYVPLLARNPLPTVHTTLRAAAQAQSFGMRAYWLGVRALTLLSLWRARRVLAITRAVAAEYLGPRGLQKIRVAPAAVEVHKGTAKKIPHLVVAVGDYYPQKNYPELLRAFKVLLGRLPEARLEIIGRPVDANVASTMKQLIADLHLSSVVKEAGPLPHDKLLKRLAAAGAFVSLSKAEAFNMPVLEALSVGTPVVAGESASLRDEIAGDAAVYVPLDKGGDVASAVAVALYGVLTTPGLANTLIAAGRRRAALFGWEKTAGIIGNTLAEVCESADEPV